MSGIEVKNAIQMSHFINLGALAASIVDGDKTVHVIGQVAGKAKGVSFRSNPNGSEPSLGITGIFEARSIETDRPIMRAPMIFLPTSFAKMLAAQLAGDQKVPKAAPPKGKSIDLDGVAEIPLALEIGIRKTKGEGGVPYEFSVVTLGQDDMKAQDALADVRALLPALGTQPALAQIAGPAPKGSRKKRR